MAAAARGALATESGQHASALMSTGAGPSVGRVGSLAPGSGRRKPPPALESQSVAPKSAVMCRRYASFLPAVALIDGVLEFYGPDDSRWGQTRFEDEDGRYCLVGAMRRVRKERGIRSDKLANFIRMIERRATG